jgi:eukaryotic-like serine/threonine-protein kinase
VKCVATPATPGRVLNGRYHLTEELARGGMAVVWIAEDTLLARRVAVKTLLPALAADPQVRVRFRNEAISAAALADPGIVATYDTGEDDGVAYIVMELVDGPNLRTVLEQRGRLPVLEALRIARGVAVALQHAHNNGVVHRDVKPANVLVPPDGAVKVTDFGIAKAAGAGDLTNTGAIIGTARYLAPEQVLAEPTDGRADVYAVGLLLYQMLTGSLPFHGDTEMATALARVSRAPDPLPDGIPAAVSAIVERCLARDPVERFPTAGALATAIDGAARNGAAPVPPRTTTAARDVTVVSAPPAETRTVPAPPAARRPAPRRTRRFVWLWAIVGGAILGAGAGAGYLAVTSASDSGGGTSNGAAVVVAAHDFDPSGDNRSENPGLVGFAIDGNAGTSWRTEHYNSPDLGGKSGVGLYVTLASTSDVSSVEVDADGTGWSAQIYVADAAASTLAGWGDPVASGEDLGTSPTFPISPARRGTVVLVWITHLPASGQLALSEVRVG